MWLLKIFHFLVNFNVACIIVPLDSTGLEAHEIYTCIDLKFKKSMEITAENMYLGGSQI